MLAHAVDPATADSLPWLDQLAERAPARHPVVASSVTKATRPSRPHGGPSPRTVLISCRLNPVSASRPT